MLPELLQHYGNINMIRRTQVLVGNYNYTRIANCDFSSGGSRLRRTVCCDGALTCSSATSTLLGPDLSLAQHGALCGTWRPHALLHTACHGCATQKATTSTSRSRRRLANMT